MKQILRLIMCALLSPLTTHMAAETPFVILLPKNANSFDRFAKNIRDKRREEAKNKKRGERPEPVPLNRLIDKTTKPTTKILNWASSLLTKRLLLGFGTGALAAYLVDRVIFAGDYSAEIALKHQKLRDYIAQRKELRGKAEHAAIYDELTELIKETRRQLAQLKALKHARAIIAPLVIVAIGAASVLSTTKK